MPQSRAGPAGVEILTPETVVGHKKAEILVGHQVQIGVELPRVAGMADDAMAVAGFFIEAQADAVDARVHAELTRVHELGCFGTKDASFAVLAALPAGRLPPGVRDNNIGFRVARDVDAVTSARGDCPNAGVR